jgi:uncharacterized protein involved in exopolysaccharide biosynthesis
MTPPKQPSNAELKRELKVMQTTQADFQTRLSILEQAKVATDAVADYLLKHPAQPQQSESKTNKELIKYIGVALGIIASLVYLLQGIKP